MNVPFYNRAILPFIIKDFFGSDELEKNERNRNN